MSAATLLPVAPRVRMTIERKAQRNHKVNHARANPGLRPLVSREARTPERRQPVPPGFPERATRGQRPWPQPWQQSCWACPENGM
eukprot:3646325-Alexandrium_andersonii.AAC.1